MNAFSGFFKFLTSLVLTLLVSIECMAQMNLNVDAASLLATWNPASGNISGYNFFLSNTLTGSTTDTFYYIPSNLVMYGVSYHACVAAMSNGAPVDSSCTDFLSLFLCPATNLAADSIDNAAYLTWDKPGCGKGMRTKSINRWGEDKATTTDTGLIGYNIYRNNAFLKFIPGPDSLSTYDMNLDDGTYCYDARAKYDLTAFNQPPGYGESGTNTTGPACLTIHANGILPFFEYWDSGNFGFNGWTNDPNWSVILTDGNPSPCASFSWEPAITSYDISLESDPWETWLIDCATIWMDFDYKLTDLHPTGNEKLAVEVYYNHNWQTITEFSNLGTIPWTSQQFDISFVWPYAFKVRFHAYGNNSADIRYWDIDNIHLYARCHPARNLVVNDPGGNPGCSGVGLTWSPPFCPETVKAGSGNAANLYGYDIFRKSNQGTDWVKVNNSVISDTTWCDHEAGIGWNTYYIRALFYAESCDLAEASNADSTWVVVGIYQSPLDGIRIFPNPADETVNITSDYGMIRIDILNFIGQTVYQDNEVYKKSARISTTSFPPGVYVAKIRTLKGLFVKKITLTH